MALGQRRVYLPIEKFDKCAVCSQTSKLRLCSACGERIYCSQSCQKSDWPKHKIQCGKTDNISLTQFYPLLAHINDSATLHAEKPIHRAARHQIINTPNPGSGDIVQLIGSPPAKLVVLGEEVPLTMPGCHCPLWWPTALSDKVRAKMFRRINRQGFVLQRTLATCLGLLATIYTTTSGPPGPDGKQPRRLRLTYNSSGIADFGIVKGVADVKSQDRLLFYYTTTEELELGQQPEDHYWIYFTTFKGEEITLDCNMFPFNFSLLVDSAPCAGYGIPDLGLVPAYFRDREQSIYAPMIWDIKNRFSVLRNKSLHSAISNSNSDIPFTRKDQHDIWDFMDRVAGKPSTDDEHRMMIVYTDMSIRVMEPQLENRAWLKWPKEPQIAIEQDPEGTDPDPPYIDEWVEYMKKWNKKYYKGKITSEQLQAAKAKWEAKHGPISGTKGGRLT